MNRKGIINAFLLLFFYIPVCKAATIPILSFQLPYIYNIGIENHWGNNSALGQYWASLTGGYIDYKWIHMSRYSEGADVVSESFESANAEGMAGLMFGENFSLGYGLGVEWSRKRFVVNVKAQSQANETIEVKNTPLYGYLLCSIAFKELVNSGLFIGVEAQGKILRKFYESPASHVSDSRFIKDPAVNGELEDARVRAQDPESFFVIALKIGRKLQ